MIYDLFVLLMFQVIRDQGIKERDNNTYPAEEGKKPYNIKKNRYKDILPCKLFIS